MDVEFKMYSNIVAKHGKIFNPHAKIFALNLVKLAYITLKEIYVL